RGGKCLIQGLSGIHSNESRDIAYSYTVHLKSETGSALTHVVVDLGASNFEDQAQPPRMDLLATSLQRRPVLPMKTRAPVHHLEDSFPILTFFHIPTLYQST
ncbi:hypothetical protein CLAIMM_08543, partial [Cladophialophora immunda]